MSRLFFGIIILLGSICLSAQVYVSPCLTDEVTARLKAANPGYAHALQHDHDALLQQMQQGGNSGGQRVVYTIPVVFHVLYNNSTQNVPNSAIYAQLETLNKDFRRRNADTSTPRALFNSVGDDVEIEFCLAKRDPLNNSVVGITRKFSNQAEWNPDSETNAMKSATTGGTPAWNTNDYLNVWIVNLSSSSGGSTAGYAYLGNSGIHGSSIDGIVLDYSIGFGGGSRTLTHEVGHYLGLRHTWGNNASCNSDDGFADTPNSSGPKFGCDLNSASCNSTDMIENYMDYANCSNMFTVQQAQFMRSVLTNFRTSLLSSDGCTAYPNTGFTTQFTNVCTGSTVQFKDTTFNDPATWQWTFPGGTPATSTLQNPAVYYPTPGTYSVTLRTSNAYGLDEEVAANYITVGTGGTSLVMEEDFENGLNGWAIVNPDNSIGWAYSTFSGNGSTQGIGINLFNYSTVGERDAILSPLFDLSTVSSATFELDYAYRQYNATDNDSLIVYVSTDGGATYPNRVYAQGGSQLAVDAPVNNNFVPAESFDWCRTACLSADLSAFAGMANVRLKIESYNDYGNNIYIDNALVFGACLAPVINSNPPQAEFTQSATGGCGLTSIQFTDESLYGATGWQWSFPGGNPPQSAQQNPVVSYAQPGNYTVSLTAFNANGNDGIVKTGVITVVDELLVNTALITSACEGSANGQASVSVNGGAPGYSFLWSNGGTDSLQSGLSGGVQTVTVTDQLGCEQMAQVTITESTAMNLQYDLAADVSSGIGTPTGYVNITVKSGTGTPPYTYTWSTGGTQAALEELVGGEYSVTVEDATGCLAFTTITVPAVDTITATTGMLTNETEKIAIRVYPNPAQEVVTLEVDAPVDASINLQIVDLMGRVVWSNTPSLTPRIMSIDLDEVENGLYLISGVISGNRIQQKLIVNK